MLCNVTQTRRSFLCTAATPAQLTPCHAMFRRACRSLRPRRLPALGVLLAPLSCNWSGQLAGKTGSNIFLHTSQCAGTLTTVGLAGLAVALLLHAPVYVLLSVKDCELDPATPVPFAGGSMVAVARVETLKVASLVSGWKWWGSL